jgi:hypothetical protein
VRISAVQKFVVASRYGKSTETNRAEATTWQSRQESYAQAI